MMARILVRIAIAVACCVTLLAGWALAKDVDAEAPPRTPLQLALLNPMQLFDQDYDVYGLRINLLYGSNTSVYGLDLGLFNDCVRDLYGIQAGIIGNMVSGVGSSGDGLLGVQIAGLFNYAESRASGHGPRGIQIAGICNYTPGAKGYFQAAGIFNLATDADFTGVQVAGLMNIGVKSMTGLAIAGLVNHTTAGFAGIRAGGWGNYTEGDMAGVQIAGVINVTVRGSVSGLEAALICNASYNEHYRVDKPTGDPTLRGIQLAGLFNDGHAMLTGAQITLGGNMAGYFAAAPEAGNSFLQLAGGFNYCVRKFTGAQVAGVLNLADSLSGVQVAGVANIIYGDSGSLTGRREGDLRGMQVSLGLNSTNLDVYGCQVGLINVADRVKGVQIGLVNIARRVYGVQIGLANFISEGAVPFFPIVNFSTSF